ncbi:MAG: hypothetical protein Q4D24_12440, partial [Erysipelotrichaceae bacterium]|nr:hypothetical protein [Erysipelotrichaceae bacterium]
MNWKKMSKWMISFVLALSTVLSNGAVFAEENTAENEPAAEETAEPVSAEETEAVEEEVSSEEETEVPVIEEVTESEETSEPEVTENVADEEEETEGTDEEMPVDILPSEAPVDEPGEVTEEEKTDETSETKEPESSSEEASVEQATGTLHSLTAEPSAFKAALEMETDKHQLPYYYSFYSVWGTPEAMSSLSETSTVSTTDLDKAGVSYCYAFFSDYKETDDSYVLSIEFTGNSDTATSALNANTRYSVQIYEETDSSQFAPFSERVEFTTLKQKDTLNIKLNSFGVVNGHYYSLFLYDLENPDDEIINGIEILAEDGSLIQSSNTFVSYNDDYYDARLFENGISGTVTPRVNVYAGKGQSRYVYADPIQVQRLPFDSNKVTDELSVGGHSVEQTVTIDDYTIADEGLYLNFFYRKAGDESYLSRSSTFYTHPNTLKITGLDENTEYEYYYTIASTLSFNPEDHMILMSRYSFQSPGTFRTKESVLYTLKDFGDPQLYLFLRSQYGSGEQLYSEDLENVTDGSQFYSGYMDKILKSIKGIEHLGSLETLDISGHNITDISPVAELRKLKSLNAQNNNLEEIPDLSKLPLEFLNLDGNLLTRETLTADKLPAAILEKDPNFIENTLKKQRTIIFENEYFTSGNSFPFAFAVIWKFNHVVHAEVTINGHSVKKDIDAYLHDGSALLEFDDLNSEEYNCGLETGKEYDTQIKVYDDDDNVMVRNITVRFEPFGAFMDVKEVSAFTNYASFNVAVLGNLDGVSPAISIRNQDGVIQNLTLNTNSTVSYANDSYYPNITQNGFNPTAFNSETLIYVTMNGTLNEGIYDVLVTINGKEIVLEDRIISYGASEGILLQYAEISHDYDSQGNYVHVLMVMDGGATSDLIPVLYS